MNTQAKNDKSKKPMLSKKGFMHRRVIKFTLKLLAVTLCVLAVFILFTSSSYPYISKRLFGSVPLDRAEFQKIDKMLLTTDFTFDENDDKAMIYGYAMRPTSYFQGDKYYFDVTVDEVIQKNVAYTRGGKAVTELTDLTADPIAVKSDYIVIGDVVVPVIMNSGQTIKKGDTVKGIFTQSSTRILEELAKKSDEDMTICSYTLDIRGLEMEAEFSDCIIWFVLIGILIFLFIKIFVYFINPKYHPIISQLAIFGDSIDIARDIDKQIAEEKPDLSQKQIYTTDWVLTKSFFKYKVSKKLPDKSSFRYTPDFGGK